MIKIANRSLQVPRTSGLDAPIMELTGERLSPINLWTSTNWRTLLGHSGEVFATRFNPTAQHIASGSMDRSIRMFDFRSCKRPGIIADRNDFK